MLSLLLDKKPDITVRNKKGQTPIDVTNSKSVISIFWQYLAGKLGQNGAEKGKDSARKKDEGSAKKMVLQGSQFL